MKLWHFDSGKSKFDKGANCMLNDNSTPMTAKDYDEKISQTIPYYSEFYRQTLDVIEQCGFDEIYWLDLGCGTGTLEEQAF